MEHLREELDHWWFIRVFFAELEGEFECPVLKRGLIWSADNSIPKEDVVSQGSCWDSIRWVFQDPLDAWSPLTDDLLLPLSSCQTITGALVDDTDYLIVILVPVRLFLVTIRLLLVDDTHILVIRVPAAVCFGFTVEMIQHVATYCNMLQQWFNNDSRRSVQRLWRLHNLSLWDIWLI